MLWRATLRSSCFRKCFEYWICYLWKTRVKVLILHGIAGSNIAMLLKKWIVFYWCFVRTSGKDKGSNFPEELFLEYSQLLLPLIKLRSYAKSKFYATFFEAFWTPSLSLKPFTLSKRTVNPRTFPANIIF